MHRNVRPENTELRDEVAVAALDGLLDRYCGVGVAVTTAN